MLKQAPPVAKEGSRQVEPRKHARPDTGRPSRQVDLDVRQRDGDSASQVSRQSASGQLAPSQVAGRVFPKIDLDALAFRMPAEEFAVYERVRMEFPHVDWTEIDLTHRAFMDKRKEFPLNLDEEGRVTYAAWLNEVETMSRAMVELRAQDLGISLSGKENDRGYFLEGFKDGAPSYTYTSNAGSAISTGASFVCWNPGLDPSLGDTINGGELYVSINDHGTIYENPEFQLPSGGGSRILVKEINDAGSRAHMTHVAGTVAAWGYYSPLQGMAPRAWIRSLIQQTTTHITTYAMATPGQLMTVTNPRTGKLQMRSVVGNTSLGDNINTNYIARSETFDTLMRDYPYYVHCFSAGNSGSGYETMEAPWSTSKNLFAIGSVNDATRDAEGAYLSGGNISTFSSRGPTYDGRIKPDFVGQGQYTLSPNSETGYGGMAGTSMSSPNVAGSVTVLMDYVRQRLPQQYLRAATYKALLINTTDDRGNAGPDYTYGWGLVNVHAAAKIVRLQAENPSQRLIIEDSLSPSQAWTETYASDGTKPIRVSIAWLDPAGTANAVGDRSPRLINDLDVRLIGPGGTVYLPYVMPFVTGQGATPAFSTSLHNALAVPGDNTTDPAEQVYIAAPAGGTYTVQVTHKGVLKDNQAQPFSVAVSGLTSVFGVTPDDGFSAAGPQGGPFDPESKTYTITNNSAASLDWSVTANPTAAWLTLTPSSGTLAGGASATMTASFNDNTLAGNYTTDLVFSVGDATVTRPVSLLVRPMTGFAWDTIPSPRYWQSPFSVNLRAVDSTGATVRSFTGTAALTPIAGGAGAGTVEIGTGTGTWDFPLKASGQKARTQAIYLSSELGAANQFTGLALNVVGTPGQVLNNFTIRVKHTATSSYHPQQSTWESSGWTTVYQQNTTISQTGWVEFPFSAPFEYNGTQNLFVDISFNNSSGATDGTVRMTTVADRRSLTGTSTSVDPLTWTITPSRVTTIPNIKLLAPGGVTITPTTTANFTNGVWSGLVTVNEASASMYLRASSGGLTGDSNSFVVEAKTIPTVTEWPTASAIAYGQAVSASTLSGGSASVPGSFSFVNPSAMLPVGTHSVPVVFTPTDTATYGTVDGMVSLAVNKATPTVSPWPTASSILYGQALSASTLSGGTASTAGTFAFVAPETTPDPGSYSAAVRFTPTDTANFNTVDGSVTVNVAKLTPTVTAWPTASGIVYEQALTASTLTGGTASVEGSFGFTVPATALNAGTHEAAVTFTPTDLTTYNTVGGSVSVAVAKATPVITAWPTASAIDYGQHFIASTLSGGSASTEGVFVFNDTGAQFIGHDAFTFRVSDGTFFSDPATVSITVGTPQGAQMESAGTLASESSAAVIIYQDTFARTGALNGNQLGVASGFTGTGTLGGSTTAAWKANSGEGYNSPNGITLDGAVASRVANDHAFLPFTPQSNFVYTYTLDIDAGAGSQWGAFGFSKNNNVNTTPGNSNTGPADIGNSIVGWMLQRADGVASGTNDALYTGANYGAPTVAVGRGTTGWNTLSLVLDTTAAQWTVQFYRGSTATGNPVNVASNAIDYIFIGALQMNSQFDNLSLSAMSNNQPPTAIAQSVTVEPGTPKAITLTGSDPESDPLTFEIVTQPTHGLLSGTAPDVVYTPPPAPAPGLYGVSVIFIPTDLDNYLSVDDEVNVEVLADTGPLVTTWPTASDIVYGQPLSASELTGGVATVDGSFGFDAPTTVLNAGTHSVAVTFTPTDTASYSPVSGSVTVVVGKATPVVTWPTASDINHGQYLSASTLSGGTASPTGNFAFNDPSLFAGHDAFTFRVSDGMFTSEPATVSITVAEAAAEPAAMASEPKAANWWTPADITTTAWWDAADATTITETAGRVSQWRDKSGSNYHWGQATGAAQPTTGTRTIGGLNALDFSSNHMALTSSGPQPGTGNTLVLAVVHADTFGTASGTSNRILNFRAGTGTLYGLFNHQGKISYNQTNSFAPAQQTMTSGTRIFGGYRTGSTLAVGTGGTYTGITQTAGAFTLDHWYLGAYDPTNTPGFWDGMIAEIVYLHAYDLETRQKIEGYLAWKWGQETSLPANHPYKLERPLNNLAPTAISQSVTAEPGTPKAITLTGSDPDGDELTYEIVTQPTYGTLSGTAPNITYTPPAPPAVGAHDVAVIFSPLDTDNYHSVTGTVSVTVIGGSSTYEGWAAEYPDHDLSDPYADSDGDGISNLQEYAFGLDPTTPSAGVISHADGVVTGRGTPTTNVINITDGVDFRAVFGRRKDYLAAGLVYQVQFSADLAAWVTSSATPTVVASDAEVDAITVPYPFFINTARGIEKPKFFRVGVSIP